MSITVETYDEQEEWYNAVGARYADDEDDAPLICEDCGTDERVKVWEAWEVEPFDECHDDCDERGGFWAPGKSDRPVCLCVDCAMARP